MIDDISAVARTLRRSPVFAAAAVVILGLGFAVTGAVFSAVAGWLSFRAAVPNADHLVFVEPTDRGEPRPNGYFKESSYERLFELKLDTLRDLFATAPFPVVLSTNGLSTNVRMEAVAGQYFAAIGVPPLLGRTIQSPIDDVAGVVPVVLAEGAWRRLFNEDRRVLGRTIRVSGLPGVVVGVMPAALRGFTSPTNTAVDLWAPVEAVRSVVAPNHRAFAAQVFGRLVDRDTLEQAQAELRIAASGFDPNAVDIGAIAVPVEEGVSPRRARLAIGAMSTALVAVSALVLVIAGANLANLLMARGAARSGEYAIRIALGASPSRILRLQLLETTSIALMGGAAGLAFVTWLSRFVGRFTLYTDGGSVMTGALLVNGWVIAYLFAAMSATAIAIGMAPALRAIRVDPSRALAGARSGASVRSARTRTMFVASQIGGSTILLIVAAFVVKSAVRVATYDTAFDAQHIAMGSFDLSALDEPRARLAQEVLLASVRAMPDFRAAALSTGLPARGGGELVSVEAAEGRYGDRQFGPPCRSLSVSPEFLKVLGMTPLQGRDFDVLDNQPERRSVIVNQSAASRLWQGAGAVGKQLRIRKGEPLTVIGVISDTDRTTRDAADRCTILVPMAQRSSSHVLLIAASQLPAASSLKRFDSGLANVLPDAVMFDVTTADAQLTRAAGFLRSMAAATMGLSLAGLTIAIVGIYGVTVYSTGLRRNEFGIRKALGETNAGIYRLVIVEALRMVGIGLLGGIPAAYLICMFLARTLVGVSGDDLAIYVGVPASLLFITVIVTCYPAWQGAKDEPSVILRSL